MNKFLAYLEKQPSGVKLIVCLLLTISLGLADYITADFSLVMFYLIPIFLATWFIGKTAGQYISILCGVELFTSDLLVAPAGNPLLSVRYWNSLMEVFFLLLSGYLLFSLKSELEEKKIRASELEAVNMELDTFNYSVTHDLSKPLTIINGYCQILIKSCSGNLDEQSRGYLREIYKTTIRMDKLIDTLLKFSHLSHSELHLQTIDLSVMAHAVELELRMADPERRCIFKIADGMTASGDKRLLKVVLDNLLGNAWKYTGKQEEAIIEFGVITIEGKRAFFVRDNGTGFDMVNAGKLFIPFQRLHGSDEYEGHGIGLATVERVIRRHGGKLWADGKPGKGASFYFTLPATGQS
jgi:light-regulated signal transduction histidine kinase (bacteriophytochrome)